MGIRDDCRHYVQRTAGGSVLRRCRLSVNEADDPFACPEGCLFFEARSVSAVGWAQGSADPMTSTGDLLPALPPRRRRGRKRR